MADEYGVARDQLTEVLRSTSTPEGGNQALLFGPRGTGKTTAATDSIRPDQKVFSVTLTAEQGAASLWGHFVPRGKEFVWQDGPVLQAWRSGGLLVINEIDHASEDVSNLLHVALDDPSVARITLPTGETVRPAAGFRCIATMNGYTEDIADAVLDRFDIATPVYTPSSEMLSVLPPEVRAEAEYQYGHLAADGEANVTYRELRAFSRFRQVVDDATAATLALSGDGERVDTLIKAMQGNGHVTEAPGTSASLNSVNRDQLSNLLENLHKEATNTLLFGPRGTGKTTTAVMSARPGQKVYSVTLTGEQSAATLWGHYIPHGNEFVWQDGPVLQAWRDGALLVINEVDHASEDVSNLLHVALDDPKVAQITLPTKETVKPAPGFRCVATMNGLPTDLAPAVLDRFDAVTPVLTPSTEMYAKLPHDLRAFAKKQYATINPDTGDVEITYRELRATAYLAKKLGNKAATGMVFGADLERGTKVLRSLSMAVGKVLNLQAQAVNRDDLETVLSHTAEPQGGNHVLLLGPRGTGKTTAAAEAALPNQEIFSVTLTAEQAAASLWGHFVPKGDEFVWQDGPVLQAWRSGGLLIINEIDHASEDVSNLLHVVLDDPSVAQITLPTKETVKPAPGFRCIATMNGTVGDINPAVTDRFTAAMVVDTPSKAMIDRLPEDLRGVARWLYSRSNPDLRDNDNNAIDPAITYRDLDAFAILRRWRPEGQAAYLAVKGDKQRAVALVEAASMQRAKLNLPAPNQLSLDTDVNLKGQAQQRKPLDL